MAKRSGKATKSYGDNGSLTGNFRFPIFYWLALGRQKNQNEKELSEFLSNFI